ncbi:30S ribosomal protein S1 [Candidatus Peregrinibacteria bacterium CG_4_9_14_0_2_um_filter_53_11]|nr:MAG: 30S ribosomal protein S1 [Candidatus Peregrinibacteria bacterium CG_4_9_14_0_2_um_filter_53_11]
MTHVIAENGEIALMQELLQDAPQFQAPALGSLVDCKVVDIFGNKILVDMDGVAVGLISGKEAHDSLDTIATLKPGDTISAYVIEGENDDGYYVLSLRKASQERTWRRFMLAYESGEMIKVQIHEANKGGLLVLVDGIKGFIPVSQLAPLHYPRVDGANAAEILTRLQQLVGEELDVKIINVDQDGGKLILSEKSALEEQRIERLRDLQPGDVVHGEVSGIVKFGIFVAFDGLEGLVHISEIEWGHVKDPMQYAKLGQKVDVQIIGIDGEKISLSMKRLLPDPWVEAAEKYSVGTVVTGTVDRITQFGVFIKLEDDISGLVHLSEMALEAVKDPHKYVKVGQEIEAKIIAIDPQDHRIGLSMKALLEPEAGSDAASEAEEKPKKSSKKAANEDVESAPEAEEEAEETPAEAA